MSSYAVPDWRLQRRTGLNPEANYEQDHPRHASVVRLFCYEQPRSLSRGVVVPRGLAGSVHEQLGATYGAPSPRSPSVPASAGTRAAHPIAQGIRSTIRFVLVSIRINARPRKRYWKSSGSLGSTASIPAGMVARGFPVGYARLM